MSEIIVAPNGMLRFLYDDDLASMLQDIASLSVARASHVEPDEEHGGWIADMAPVGGPILGPFATRGQALSEETGWLRAHSIPIPDALKPEHKESEKCHHGYPQHMRCQRCDENGV